jgi:endonuclease-3
MKTNKNWPTILSLMKESLSPAKASVTEISQITQNSFAVLVSTIISLRTKDQVTFERSRALLAQAPSPQILMTLSESEIAELIYPCGFFRVKAKQLKAISEILIKNSNGQVPSTWEELLALPGVGRKTAGLVLGLGFGIPAICVDIHVHRIANRLGTIATTKPEQTELALMDQVPQDSWILLNDIMVRFGQQICTPQSPYCSRCPLTEGCPRIGVQKSR